MAVFVKSTNNFAVMCGRLPAGLVPMTSLSGVFSAKRDELGERAHAELWRASHHQTFVCGQAIGIMSLLTSNGRFSFCAAGSCKSMRGPQQGMAVGLLAKGSSRANDAAAAGLVLDHDLLAP